MHSPSEAPYTATAKAADPALMTSRSKTVRRSG